MVRKLNNDEDTSVFSVRMETRLLNAIKAEAAETDEPMAKIIRNAIRSYFRLSKHVLPAERQRRTVYLIEDLQPLRDALTKLELGYLRDGQPFGEGHLKIIEDAIDHLDGLLPLSQNGKALLERRKLDD